MNFTNKKFIVDSIEGKKVSNLCQDIIQTLPEWFGIQHHNEKYIKGVAERICFYAEINGNKIGLISIEQLYPGNINIYWLGIKPEYHRQGIGTKLMQKVLNYCYSKNITTITVETLSSKEEYVPYLNTYQFYLYHGFRPLFDRFVDNDNTLVIMQKTIGLPPVTYIDLTHSLTTDIPSWDGSCGFTNEIKLDYQDCKTEPKFRVQQLKMHAGIGTHLDAPAHCVPTGSTVDTLDIAKLILPCVKIDLSKKIEANISLTIDDLIAFEDNYGNCFAGKFVIIYTGWEKYWGIPTQYCNEYNFPSVTKSAAQFLLQRNVAGIGIDTLSPDRPKDEFMVHKLFLENNRLIIENIANANLLPTLGSYVIVLPLKIANGTEAPIRLIAMIF